MTTTPASVPLVVEGDVRLAGTRVRASASPRAIAVLLPGSGPVDRDGNVRALRLGIQRQLAEALGARGIDSVRWDKRGVGESGGQFLPAGFDDLRDDALRVVDDVLTEGVPVVLIGHSEGSAVATRVAADRPAVAGLVLLSAYARSGREVLRWQARGIAHDLPPVVRAILRLTRTNLYDRSERTRERLAASTADVQRIDGVRINARWFREFMAYDPSHDLARVNAPVLAITGSYDLQAPPDDLNAIAATAAGSVRTVEIPGLSHILRTQDAPTLRSYRRDARRPIDERVTSIITAWWADEVRVS